jgi:hypothetical protein
MADKMAGGGRTQHNTSTMEHYYRQSLLWRTYIENLLSSIDAGPLCPSIVTIECQSSYYGSTADTLFEHLFLVSVA